MSEMTLEYCQEWWEAKVAAGYFEKYSFGFSRPELIDRLRLSTGERVLELGPGYGRETSQFCKITPEVYISDVSESALELAQSNAEVTEARVYDGCHLPWEDGHFDLVYSCFVIQHMSKASAEILLEESLRVLKNGGHVLHEFFENGSYYVGEGEDGLSGGSMFNNSWPLDEIKGVVERVGGEIAWVETVDHGMLGNEAMPTYNHWVCMRSKHEV